MSYVYKQYLFFSGFELNDKGVVDEQDEDESTSNNNLMSSQMDRPLMYRIWKYLKTTWTGVIARNGKKINTVYY